MRTTQPDKRTRLVETATKLAYGRGFREASLADIAEAARVPVGNVYYYFKTKEELAEAVVERRLEEFRADREEWNRLSSPKERLLAFVGRVQANREQLARGGCALGGLCTELHKEAALSRRNPRRSSMSLCVGLRSSSGPLAVKRIRENSRSICSPPFRVWRLLRSAPTTPRWW
jgi:AcrR family transcriptional regulator